MCHKVALPELPAVLTLRRTFSKEDAQFFCKKPSALQADFFMPFFHSPPYKALQMVSFYGGYRLFSLPPIDLCDSHLARQKKV